MVHSNGLLNDSLDIAKIIGTLSWSLIVLYWKFKLISIIVGNFLLQEPRRVTSVHMQRDLFGKSVEQYESCRSSLAPCIFDEFEVIK